MISDVNPSQTYDEHHMHKKWRYGEYLDPSVSPENSFCASGPTK